MKQTCASCLNNDGEGYVPVLGEPSSDSTKFPVTWILHDDMGWVPQYAGSKLDEKGNWLLRCPYTGEWFSLEEMREE